MVCGPGKEGGLGVEYGLNIYGGSCIGCGLVRCVTIIRDAGFRHY